MKKQIQCKRDKNGCQVVVSHALNADGYARLMFQGLKGKHPRMVMVHRVMYEAVYGPIPSGYEVDHKCKNRACCNPNHLQLLPRQEHRSKDNSVRYRARYDKAIAYWEEHRCSGSELGRRFGVSPSQGAAWVRWHKQGKYN